MTFNTFPFLELLSEIVDNRGKTCPTSETGIPLIATNCVRNDSLYPLFEKVRYVDDETYKTWFRGHPKPGDMLFVTKGTPGRVCWVPDPVNFCIAQDMLSIRANGKIVYPKFLFALLRSQETQKLIENMHVGTLIPHFKKGDFDQLHLSIPSDRKVQETIGDIYFNISEQIDLNRQTNQTLEAIAQALFKEWFVDFNFPGATGEMQESELGPIPKGWRVGKLEDVCELNPRLNLRRGIIAKYIEMKNLSQNSLSIEEPRDREFTSGSKFQNGDTLLARITPCLENGKTGFVDFLNEQEVGWGSTEFLVLRGKKEVGQYFVYCLSRTQSFREFAIQSMVGSSGRQRVVESILSDYPLVIPDRKIVSSFSKKMRELFNLVKTNSEQASILSQIRDNLLPKLLSGEIDV